MAETFTMYNDLLKDSGPAALVLRQPLMSVEGPEAVIFPPTYANPKSGDPPIYNIDTSAEEVTLAKQLTKFEKTQIFVDKARVERGRERSTCAIDSIGSQANRIEPLFKREKYKHLVPQIEVSHAGGPTNLLDAGHRIADAIVRFSELLVEIHNAFTAYQSGDPERMARLAPTSLVFGAWDSRGTQIKIPRVINLRIDATDVERRTRSAQYVPATDYVGNGLIDEVDENTGSDLGFAAVPATGQLGGVRARGPIVRSGYVNLVTLQSLENGAEPSDLQRYILGLTLVALTAHESAVFSLRQGCQLVANPEETTTLKAILATGKPDDRFKFIAADALTFATEAAEKFGINAPRTVAFDSVLANRTREIWAEASETDKKALKAIAKLRPLTLAELARFANPDNDPLAAIGAAVKAVKGGKKNPGKLPEKAKRGQPVIVSVEAFADVRKAVEDLKARDGMEEGVTRVVESIQSLLDNDKDSHATLRAIEGALKDHKRQSKQPSVPAESDDDTQGIE
ncbi:MAG: type I-U CRISPR-associated RAMP protein Csb1/Cas7u [Tepidisphaeraceae bacterium]